MPKVFMGTHLGRIYSFSIEEQGKPRLVVESQELDPKNRIVSLKTFKKENEQHLVGATREG